MKWIFTLLILFYISFVCKADHWTRKRDFPGPIRRYAFSFVIGDKAYVGGGSGDSTTPLNDFWEYDPSIDTWTKKADLPRSIGYYTPAFAVGGHGYVYNYRNADSANILFEYDAQYDKWIEKTHLPGGPRIFPSSFVIGNKAYIGGGGFDLTDYTSLYSYDVMTNSWIAVADIPHVILEAVSFSINNKGYITSILDQTLASNSIVLEYNPISNSWSQKSNFIGNPRTEGTALVIGSAVYYGLGDQSVVSKDWWQYDAITDSWKQRSPIPCIDTKDENPSFTIKNKGYVCFGGDDHFNDEVWEYSPDSVIGVTFCEGTTFNLSIDTPYGLWNSDNTAVASVDSFSGVVKAIKPGVVTITKQFDSFIETYIITIGSTPVLTANVSQIQCHGANDGSIATTISGGSGDFEYTWSTSGSDSFINNLGSGMYLLNVQDNVTHCALTDSFSISEPDSMHITANSLSDTCKEGKGSIDISVTGGTPPYKYLWPVNLTGNNATGLVAGAYNVAVVDGKNCQKNASIIVGEHECYTDNIYPSPANSSITVTSEEKIKTIAICNALEQTVYRNHYNSQKIEINIVELPAGVYFVKINGSQIRKFIKE